MAEIILAIISILGVAGTFYYGYKSLRLARTRTHFDWTQMRNAGRLLSNSITRRFKPDMILAIQGGGGIFAHLILFEMGEEIPLDIIKLLPKSDPTDRFSSDDFLLKHTTKWNYFIPKELGRCKHLKVLLVDDFAITGDSLSKLREALMELGFPRAHITTASAICSQAAIDAQNRPDFYWTKSQTVKVYLPWGPGQKLERMGIVSY